MSAYGTLYITDVFPNHTIIAYPIRTFKLIILPTPSLVSHATQCFSIFFIFFHIFRTFPKPMFFDICLLLDRLMTSPDAASIMCSPEFPVLLKGGREGNDREGRGAPVSIGALPSPRMASLYLIVCSIHRFNVYSVLLQALWTSAFTPTHPKCLSPPGALLFIKRGRREEGGGVPNDAVDHECIFE